MTDGKGREKQLLRLRLVIAGLVLLVAALGAICSYLLASAQATWAPAPTATRASPTPSPTPEAPPTPGAEHPDYMDLYPELMIHPERWGSVGEEKTVYLTFDDGPSARTAEILDILQRYGVKATFFTVGQTDEAAAGLFKRIAAEGHCLGVHSFSHDYRTIYSSVEAFLTDFKAQYDWIVQTTGVHPQIFRFPGGSINSYSGGLYQELVAEMTRRGFAYFDWNVSGGDATGQATAASVAAGATRGMDSLRRAVVLLHDSAPRTYTVAALPAIIEAYQAAGFTFRTLSPQVRAVTFSYPNPKQGD